MSLPSITNIKLQLQDWLRENKRLRAGLLLLVVLLIADVLLFALLVSPYRTRLQEREAQLAELKKSRSEAILFQKQKSELAGLKKGIPTQRDMPLLIKDLVQTARRLNLTVSSITYDIPKRSGKELTMLSFQFPAEGRYPDIKRFIHEVETSDRLVGIQDVKLNENEGRVKLDMKLVTYVKESVKEDLK